MCPRKTVLEARRIISLTSISLVQKAVASLQGLEVQHVSVGVDFPASFKSGLGNIEIASCVDVGVHAALSQSSCRAARCDAH